MRPATVIDLGIIGTKNSIFEVQVAEKEKKRMARHEFRISLPAAREVKICGSFNNWSTNGLHLFKRNGAWSVTLNLNPGRYEYKVLVDGAWYLDPAAGKVSDIDGNENSTIVMKGQENPTYGLESSVTA
jgi:1,4-alpha-glucan branching enzyme